MAAELTLRATCSPLTTAEAVTVDVDVGVNVAVGVKVKDGVGDLSAATAVCVTAASTVCSQGVAWVSVGMVIARPPANMGVRSAAGVTVKAAVEVCDDDKEATTLGTPTVDVALDAGTDFVFVG